MNTSSTRSALELTPGHAVDRIVAPTSLDERYDRGVAAAAALAERFGLPLHLISASEPEPDTIDVDHDAALAGAAKQLRAAHPSLAITHESLAAVASPEDAVADRLRISDLTVVATRAIDDPDLSFAQTLATSSGTPVLMLGPDADLGELDSDVVVPVDGSVLAERILPAARGLAAALGVNVKLVHIVPTAVSRHVESLRSRGERVSEQAYIHDLHARLDDPSISWEVVHHDDPAVALSHLDSHRAPAVIAMATHGREGFVARVFGSITTATVAKATCPVLVQRPTGDLNLKELE